MNNKKLDLYYNKMCPYCVKVLQAVARLGLKIGHCNTFESQNYKELMQYGGSSQVPCLRIQSKDKISWMYESSRIIDYLVELNHRV